MRVLHLSDLHIGKKLKNYDRLAEQKERLAEIIRFVEEEGVELVLIAGDVYDNSTPSKEAIQVEQWFLQELNLKLNVPVCMISGNHDGERAQRLAIGKQWTEAQQLHISTTIEDALRPIEIGPLQIFLLPFMNEGQIGQYMQKNYASISKAMADFLPQLEKQFKEGKYHLLVGHCTMGDAHWAGSEMESSIGGLEALPATLFSNFDYVALGHLHQPQVVMAGKIYYAGSLLKYSANESEQKKGMYCIDFPEDGTPFSETCIHLVEFHQGNLPDIVRLEDSMENLCTLEKYATYQDDYVVLENITNYDCTLVERLFERFPRFLQVNYALEESCLQEDQTSAFIQQAKQENKMDACIQSFCAAMDFFLNEDQEQLIQKVMHTLATEEEVENEI